VALEAAPHAGEGTERLDHGLIGQFDLGGHGDGRQRIEHVVHARQVQRDVQVRHHRAIAALHREAHLAAHQRLDIDGTHLRILAETIGDDGP